MTNTDHITIRLARPQDGPAIRDLAQLDSARCPRGRVLVAEVAGELHAAMAIESGATVADPFRHTSDLVRLLDVRRRQALATEDTRRRTWTAPVLRLRSARAA